MRVFSIQPLNQKLLLGILLAGFALRLAAVASFDPPSVSDDKDYQELARSIVEGNRYALDGAVTAYRTPGYPLIIAGMYAVCGFSKYPVRILQVFLDMGSCLLLFAIGKKLFSDRIGLLAAGCFALFPTQILYTCHLMTETSFTFFLLLFTWVAINDNRSQRVRNDMILGLLLGIEILIRSTGALLPIVIFIYRWRRGYSFRRNLGEIILLGSFALLVLSPWLIRNYVQFHRISITSNTGVNFWIGSHDGASGAYSFPKANNPLEEVPDEFARSDLGVHLGIQFILHQPLGYAMLLAKKFAHFFGADYWLMLSIQQIPDWRMYPNAASLFIKLSPWLVLALQVPFAIVLLLGTFGLTCNRPADGTKILLIRSVVLYWLIVHLIFYAGARYRFPIVPLLMLAAAYALCTWRESLAQMGKRRVLLFSMLVLLFLAGWVAEYATVRARAIPFNPLQHSKDLTIPSSPFLTRCQGPPLTGS